MTLTGAESEITQVFRVPVQAPDQLANEDPVFGVAVSVMLAPFTHPKVQVPGQLMPAGDEVTVPDPTFVVEVDAMVTAIVGLAAASAGTAESDPPMRPTSTRRAAGPVRRSMGTDATPFGPPREAPF